MGRTFESIDQSMREWVSQQALYFVGTAPIDPEGHINVSPKGSMRTFAILGERQIAYIDLVGSGIETTAHLQENGRIVVMFCAFSGPPKIVRFHGRGHVVPENSPEFETLLAHFTIDADIRNLARSVIVIAVDRISDSCGFVVPQMVVAQERTQLQKWADTRAEKDGPGWKRDYISARNATNIDGLPGLITSSERS